MKTCANRLLVLYPFPFSSLLSLYRLVNSERAPNSAPVPPYHAPKADGIVIWVHTYGSCPP
jgi:hypothetical protein